MSDISDQVMQSDLARALFGDGFGKPVEVGRFVVLDRLGGGGMGVVYGAYDPTLHRRVALKVLRRAPGKRGPAHARLRREAVALAKLSHPNVVAVHEVGEVAGETFVAMEYVDGVDLARWAAEHPVGAPRRQERALELLRQAGHGLVAAHAAGLVHRDFKPSNVLVGADGRARVADFGLVRSVSDADASAIAGTLRYMAPEQQRGDTVGPAADQFAFCVTAWEVLFGERPDDARRIPDGATRWIADALRRGLAEDPQRRYPSMRALLGALRRDPGARRRRLALAGLGGIAAAAAVGGWLHHRAHACDPPVPADTEPEFAAAWGQTYAEICRSDALGADERAAAQGCLALQWADYEVQREVATVTDPPDPDACRTASAAMALPQPPDAVLASYREVRAAGMLLAAGQREAAEDRFDAADIADHPIVQGMAIAFTVDRDAAANRIDEADAGARRGYEAALRAGTDGIAAEFALRLGKLARQRGRNDEATVWDDHARWLQ